MSTHSARSTRPGRAALGMRWLALVVILFGTLIASVGGMNSHGIAAIAAATHAASATTDTAHEHGHVHDDADISPATLMHGPTADHPHHGADHSHDKAHALPSSWDVATPQPPLWIGQARLWIEMVEASRLERPPMG